MTTDTTYNGWTNRETWLTNLHFDCAFEEQADEAYKDAEADEIFDKADNATSALADIIKEYIEEYGLPEYDSHSFMTDIIGQFMRSINFHEIAKHYIENLEV